MSAKLLGIIILKQAIYRVKTNVQLYTHQAPGEYIKICKRKNIVFTIDFLNYVKDINTQNFLFTIQHKDKTLYTAKIN